MSKRKEPIQSKTSKFEWKRDDLRIENIISALIWTTKSFLEVSVQLDVRHCAKLHSCVQYQGILMNQT